MNTFATRTLAGALALLLAACATPTPYQALKNGEGYAEQRLETNRYKITFTGNSLTPKQTVENYLLYRAAEVTLNNGYDYFVLTDQNTEGQTYYLQNFNGGFGSYYWYPRYAWGANVGTSVPRTEYEGQASILVYKGQKPANEVKAFDARDLKSNLAATIRTPEQKKR